MAEARKWQPLPSASWRRLHVSAPSPLVFVSRGVHVLLVPFTASLDARLKLNEKVGQILFMSTMALYAGVQLSCEFNYV